MEGNSSQVFPTRPRRLRNARSNASIALSHTGGAAALDTAIDANTDLTGLQSPLDEMAFASNEAAGLSFSILGYGLVDSSASFIPFSPSEYRQGNEQYLVPSPHLLASHSRIVDPTSTGLSGAAHQQSNSRAPDAIPWNHLAATQGGIRDLSDDVQTRIQPIPKLAINPGHRRTCSTFSGQDSVEDSAYWTGPKTYHEAESVTSSSEEQMDRQNKNYIMRMSTPTQTGIFQSSRSSSTITPALYSDLPRQSNTSVPNASTPLDNNAEDGSESSTLYCDECKYAGKTRSDMKKHNARHERKYKCHYHACSRRNKGFATSNDLDRHLKSVHHVNNRKTKYYKCFANGCPRASKLWPRQDNFKQHLVKMHKGQEEDDLMRRSEQWYAEFQRQRQAGPRQEVETQSQTTTDEMVADMANMPVRQQLAVYNYPESTASYNSGPPLEFSMVRTQSFDLRNIDPRLSSPSEPCAQNSGSQRRRDSTPVNPADLRQQILPSHASNTQSFAPPRITAVRPRSQTGFDQPLPTSRVSTDANLSNKYSSVHEQPWTGVQSHPPAMKVARNVKYAWENEQMRMIRGPYTVANPFLDVGRMTEVPSPQEVQPAMLHELRGEQEDIVMNADGGATGDAVTPISPLCPQVKVTPPEGESKHDTTRLTKRLVDEIAHILGEHRALSNKDGPSLFSLSEEELLARFRSSLRSSVSSVGSSSLSLVTGDNKDSETSAVKKCPATNQTYHICQQCGKIKMRASELKKHMQRHERPFGCTYDQCNKTFGSKNDWKRHEQSQHEQQECWRCLKCRKVIYHGQNHYVEHMRQVHCIDRIDGTEHSPGNRRIARNHQGRFWCGFCKTIIAVTPDLVGVDAITYRFNHVSDHFVKDKMNIKSWVELDAGGKNKGSLIESSTNSTHDTPQEADEDEEGDKGDKGEGEDTIMTSSYSESDSPESSYLQGGSSHEKQTSQLTLAEHMMLFSGPPVNKIDAQSRRSNVGKSSPSLPQGYVIKCCQCGTSASWSLGEVCMDCGHKFCTIRCKSKVPKVKD
ncbi:hypothetical protein, variant [Exophiala oligosperma]|uniref:C2H2-type domain-containing protein n=1 Tax=Exophiala oligosperma TaxID=215243 RepID=A0A0D2EJI4_9EURO|nr:uncharacterized protein PV06_00700 [Exophiala oligosperma]XP_016268290.1 hypothetical protein, variant [Exophiala oligosperma]KIW48073.1 hypothetical protein PV06_00700 [Exophiala oligosperma]KIW48074.1 hypothetical protein, variant [Exophiala oligosperma]